MNTQKNETKKIFCNRCGRELKMENAILQEGAASMEIDWGYFSNKDGEHHSFCLCEDCYDKVTGEFQIPVTVEEKNELI